MENFKIVHQVVKKTLEKGLISYWFLSSDNAFRIAPPLNITYNEIDEACEIIMESMNEIFRNFV